MTFDWENHRKHREQVKHDTGQWIGLADENWEPIMDLPPVIEMTCPAASNAKASAKIIISTRVNGGHISPIVDELIAENLTDTDSEGRLLVAFQKNRFIIIERNGFRRRCIRITHAIARGQEMPTTIEVHGVDEMDVWESIPCPSAPSYWTATRKMIDRDWAQKWSKPYQMAEIKLAAVADGFTVSGPAESTIRKLVVDSLAAFWRVTGITDEPVVVDLEPMRGRESPHVLIRPEDGSLLDTVKDAAKNAGVLLSCHLWWPGDITPVGHPDLAQPCYVLGVKQRTAV